MSIVAITGGAQGIGRATAYHFAAAGYAVSICDPDDDAGHEALDHIRSLGAKGLFAAADVAREDDVRHWMARTEHELGCPDVLINNAGISRNKPFPRPYGGRL